MKTFLMLASAALGLSAFFATVGQAQTALAGKWQNIDPRTGGMASIAIVQSGPGLDVQVWGRCHPIDCDWGKTRMLPVGESVDDRSFRHGFAIWQLGSSTRYVSFSLNADGDLLSVSTITIFSDRSGRSNFRVTERFRRSGTDPL